MNLGLSTFHIAVFWVHLGKMHNYGCKENDNYFSLQMNPANLFEMFTATITGIDCDHQYIEYFDKLECGPVPITGYQYFLKKKKKQQTI